MARQETFFTREHTQRLPRSGKKDGMKKQTLWLTASQPEILYEDQRSEESPDT
jgi:hypothetical protein